MTYEGMQYERQSNPFLNFHRPCLFATEVADEVAKGQARVVLWDDIKHDHPKQLKISPVAAIPHKSRAYRSILDLSFALRLDDGGTVPSVNDTPKAHPKRRDRTIGT